ncbi:hypothetical protein F4677DRAFT_449617 [Hypoxylon crocopeplum]|nr:hypothetical protein F4677DRAFT_449617 [Hypoxylon crocopeplum]
MDVSKIQEYLLLVIGSLAVVAITRIYLQFLIKIIEYLRKLGEILRAAKEERKDTAKWYRHELRGDLMYHVNDAGRRRLMIPSSCVKELLEITHDASHHFGPKRMLHDLEGVCIQNITRKVKEYVEWCPDCQENRTDISRKYGELLPINSKAQPYHTVAWDFIVALPKVLSKATPCVWPPRPWRPETPPYIPVADFLSTL